MQLQQTWHKSSKIAHNFFLHILILLIKTLTAIYNMGGKFWSLKTQPMSHFQLLKCPTIIRDFPVQKVVTERVPRLQIYLHN